MSNNITIEHNIPIPHGRGTNHMIISDMKDGDSVLLPTRSRAIAFQRSGVTIGVRVTMRRVGGGYRVWRLGEIAKEGGR